jgi:small subunit ribosomal protein S3
LKDNYELENPQVEVKEVDIPELNPKIMAHKIAAMLQRGMHFRRVAYSTLRRIMGSGAQGVEISISGKIRGSRSATAKFSDGYIKKCGEPATRYVNDGFATVQLKPGVLGICVRIMPPGVVLPDKVDILQPTEEEAPATSEEGKVEEEVTEESAEILEEITEEAPEDAVDVPTEAEEPEKEAEAPEEEPAPESESVEEKAAGEVEAPEEEPSEEEPSEVVVEAPEQESQDEKEEADEPLEEKEAEEVSDETVEAAPEKGAESADEDETKAEKS